MTEQIQHPDWCSPTACTAMDEAMEPLHRSEPFVIDSGEPGTVLYLHRAADPDGSGEYVTLAKLDCPVPEAWFLAEPVGGHEIILPRTSAESAQHALAEMV
ncbi:hypothetical protein ACPPVO_02130 [Dactylosporangium sp. McL0621]|uniref:hypothetical protein n=1 Tax=Dactylosporangium sp. McL0621 TaxID=3415678 RepID=UPI003CE981F7